jgi:hypothetical protein
MNRQEWEQDVRNRQRNIVFPDTNLNQGRFYRNIASGKAVFSTGQKASLLLMVAYYVSICALFLAGAISELTAGKRVYFFRESLELVAITLWPLMFWLFLAFKGFFPAPAPARKRRGGYRTGSRG